jgi:hypothetical protein
MKRLSCTLISLFLMQGCCTHKTDEQPDDIKVLNAFNKYTDANGLRYYTNGKVTDIRTEELPPHAAALPRRLITLKLNSPAQEVITYRVPKEQPCNIKVGDTVAVHGWLKLYEE